ncbi:hypothetical protein NA57DRAFT_60731 [Rhizodiscina lignyota]|uniref:Uncharacterized protein n=1 Tax=Rhizodiscina lignyota TaxID=1504668 RepID=A0A9P4I6J0_9PEZI|nr:hypothetical protein NA57DRAFT_60731 [Rhizodiscina lignyota]
MLFIPVILLLIWHTTCNDIGVNTSSTTSESCTRPSIWVSATNTCGVEYGGIFNGCDPISLFIPPCPSTSCDCGSATGTSSLTTATELTVMHFVKAQALPPSVPLSDSPAATTSTNVTIATIGNDPPTATDSSGQSRLPTTATNQTAANGSSSYTLPSDAGSQITAAPDKNTLAAPGGDNVSCASVCVDKIDKCWNRYGYATISKPDCSKDPVPMVARRKARHRQHV